MLDRMRRHKGILKWALVAVILTFVLFYVPDFMQTSTGAAPNETVATVEDTEITVREFTRRYSAQLQAYRQAYGAQMNEQLLRQLGIEQQILQQLVDEEAMVAEARRQGMTVNDVEIRERILAMPAFQENGQFIGEQRYRQLLSMNPGAPLTTQEFEEQIRRALLVQKLRDAVSGWMSVSDSDIADEYRRRNEKVKLDVVPITPDAFKSLITVNDADLAAYFDTHKDTYRIGEKRKIKYAVVDVEKVRETVKVSDAEIEAFYKQNLAQYQTPEEVRASHILFKTEGKNEADVQAKAAEVLKRAKAGEDFAALAKQYSEDESNSGNGGDLSYFPRGAMVSEFETAAFSMKTGDISDLVKTSFGFHIIKKVDHRQATTRPVTEVRTELEDQLKWQKAQAEAEKLAKSLESQVKSAADLDRIAKERGLHTQETGMLLRDDPIDGLGPSPEVSAQAFQLQPGAVSPVLRVARGWIFATVTGKQDPYVPQLTEVKEKVREDVSRERAAEIAKTKAAEIAAALKSAPDFAGAVKKAGLEVKTTELITRGSAVPDIGISADVDKIAFSLPKGGVSDPVSTPQGTAIVRVVEKEDVTPEQIAAGRDQLRDELANQRRDQFFSAYMQNAKKNLKIEIRQDTLARVVGARPVS
jgi:peptidyl-prolyl cis-trans isomerase D